MSLARESASHAFVALGLAASLACTSPPPSEGGGEDPASSPGPATGTLEGFLRLAENVPVPEPRIIQNTTDPEVCGESHRLEEAAVSLENRGVSDGIVALTEIPAAPRAPSTVTLDNRECRFAPRVMVATLGSLLETTNSDPVLHTTHLYGPREVNVSLPVMGARQTRVLAAPGLFVVKCDVHGWMEAYIRVDEHPYHAVSDGSGAFRIDGVPAGKHRIEVWHPHFGSLERDVEIAARGTTSIEVELGKEENR